MIDAASALEDGESVRLRNLRFIVAVAGNAKLDVVLIGAWRRTRSRLPIYASLLPP